MSNGQQVDAALGVHGKGTFIGLRSRKTGGGSTTRELAGVSIGFSAGLLSAHRTQTINGISIQCSPGAVAVAGASRSWIATPSLSYYTGSTGDMRIGSYLSGGYQAGDVITVVSGNPGFIASPSGDQIPATGAQTVGTYTNLVLGFQPGGTGPVINSAPITITVTTAEINYSSKFISGPWQFAGSYLSNQNAPLPNTHFHFGKQQEFTVGTISGVYKLFHTAGDGSNKWNNVVGNYNGSGLTYNDVLAFDFNNLASGVAVDQLFDGYGKNKNGVTVSSYPHIQEGGTHVWDSDLLRLTVTPGFMRSSPPPGAERDRMDPYGVMVPNRGKVHYIDPLALTSVAGPDLIGTGKWLPEHWGGAYNPNDQKVWLQGTTGGENNGMHWFKPSDGTDGVVNFSNSNVASIPIFPGSGRGLNTHFWAQAIRHSSNEMIAWDGFRGNVIAINLTTFDVRIVAYLGALRDVSYPTGDIEAISSQEFGLTIDQVADECVVAAQGQIYFKDPSEHFDIATVNLATGATQFTRYPNLGMQTSTVHWVPKASGGGNLVLCDTGDSRYTDRFFVFNKIPNGLRRSAALASTAQFEVRTIPHSQLCSAENLFVMNACRANAGLSQFTAPGQPASQGTNKDGITWSHWEGQNWWTSSGANPYGHVPSPTDYRWFFRMGDVQWPAHNGVAAFDILAEHWTPEVVKTINHLEIRYPNEATGIFRPANTNGWTGEYEPATLFRNWNGGCVAQHGYWTGCVFGPRNQYFGHISGQQPAPSDNGGTDAVIIATLSDGLWLPSARKPVDPVAPPRPGWQNDIQDWVDTHPTQRHLIYSYSSNTGHVHKMDTSAAMPWSWTQVTATPLPSFFRCSPSFDVENNELLLIGQNGSGVKQSYTVNLSTGAVTAVTLTGAGASGVDPWYHGGMTYDSDSHAHYFLGHVGRTLHKIVRTNATTFTCTVPTLTGYTLASSLWNVQGGGMLKRLCAMPGMGGLVMEISDLQPLYFIGTV